MTVTATNTLFLTVGSRNQIQMDLVDENGSAESLTGMSVSQFVIGKSVGDTSVLSATSGLTISGSSVLITLTAVQADALAAGTYLGSLKISRASDATVVHYSEPFRVVIGSKPV